MDYLIESIKSIEGVFRGVVIDKYDFKARKIKVFKIQLYLANNYTYVYASSSKLGDVDIGNFLLLKLSLINYGESLSVDKYPIIIVKSTINSEIMEKSDLKNNIEEISNSKIKKINEFAKQNNEYLFNLVKDYDNYSKDNFIIKKVTNYLELIKLATFSKIKIENNEAEGSIDIIYRKEGSHKDVEVFSIVFDDTFTAFEYLDRILFFETDDKYQIFRLINKVFKHFNIRLDKNIDLEMKFIEVFASNENNLDQDKAKDEYKKTADAITLESEKKIKILKDKQILIIGRGVLEYRQDLIIDICTSYGFNKKNITIENDNNRIKSKGEDYINKIKNNIFSGVIVGQIPHSSSGKYEANSLLDKIKEVANPKYCYVHATNISLSDETKRVKLKLSKARLKNGLEKIVDHIIKNDL